MEPLLSEVDEGWLDDMLWEEAPRSDIVRTDGLYSDTKRRIPVSCSVVAKVKDQSAILLFTFGDHQDEPELKGKIGRASCRERV